MIKQTLLSAMLRALAQFLNAKNLSAVLLLATGLQVVHAEPAPKAELVAPGIWRIRLGKPEKFTPTFFRAAVMDKDNLKTLPAVDQMPLNAAQISFTVSARGCAVRLPMTADESIYGFGLNTELFDMTQTETGHTGRRVFLKPTDHPENDLGESHAPVPFFVSSRG